MKIKYVVLIILLILFMANPVWGLLLKSQIDAEKIEEAIARLIAAHEADEEAHLGTGQSLQSHKASEIIDHLAESIVEDKLANGAVTSPKITSNQITGKDFRTAENVGTDVDGVKFNSSGIQMWQDGLKKVDIPISGSPIFRGNVSIEALSYLKNTFIVPFESLAGYEVTLTGDSDINSLGCALYVIPGSNVGDIAKISSNENLPISPTSSKNPSIAFSAKVDTKEDNDFYFIIGSNDPTSNLMDYFGIKFKASTGKVYLVYRASGGSEVARELSGVDPEVIHNYRVALESAGSVVRFWVDGVEVDLALLSWDAWGQDYMFCIYGKSVAGAGSPAWVWNFVVQQDF